MTAGDVRGAAAAHVTLASMSATGVRPLPVPLITAAQPGTHNSYAFKRAFEDMTVAEYLNLRSPNCADATHTSGKLERVGSVRTATPP